MPSRLKILAPDYDYLTLDRELLVQELSDGVPEFTESSQNSLLQRGNSILECFHLQG